MDNDEIIVAVDLGNSKLAAMAAKKTDDGKLEILGLETDATPTDSIRYGIVRKPSEVAYKIAPLIRKLENRINRKVHIHSFYVGVNGLSLNTYQFNNKLDKSVKITEDVLVDLEDDLLKKLEQKNFYTEYFSEDGERELDDDDLFIYDTFPQEFNLNGDTVVNPIGEEGGVLTGNYAVVAGKSVLAKNMDKVIQCSTFKGTKLLAAQSLASAFLSEREKQLGCALVDFGANCTTLTIYHGGYLRYVSVVPFGGNTITSDICDLNILFKDAEKLKVNFGNAVVDSEENKGSVQIPSGIEGMDDAVISKKELALIINARLEEIADYIYKDIKKSGFASKLGAGMVVTGGASQLKNLHIVLQDKMLFAVRCLSLDAYLSKDQDRYSKPEYALLVSLLLAGDKNCCDKKSDHGPIPNPRKNNNGLLKGVRRLMDRIPDMFEGTSMDE